MRRARLFFVSVTFLLSCIFVAGCGKPELYSKWRNRQIAIDGKFEDWQNEIAYYDKNTRVSIGVINDDAYLYICLITRNRGLMEQLTRAGFSVWFDPDGGTAKVFGIHFPLGIQGKGMPMEKRSEVNLFQESWQQIEIIGPGKEEKYTTSIEEIEKDGISVKLGMLRGYFIYELKVPLVENDQHPYYIGAQNKLIGMGFETSLINKEMPPGMGMPGRGGMRGAPGGGGGGMPGGGMGGMPGGKPFDDENRFQLWMTVMLSSG